MSGLFKGFVRTRNKQSTMRFKNAQLLTRKEAEAFDEYAGVLAENTVLIDIDDHDQAEAFLSILEERKVKTCVRRTARGMHFYFLNDGTFKKCYTGTNLACGLTADIKVGLKSSYAVLKAKGKERPIVYGSEDSVDTAPFYARPVATDSVFWKMGNGDGRNNALFSYEIALAKQAKLDKDEVRETLRILNSHVLSDPLSEEELETVSRPEAIPQENPSDEKWNLATFSQKLLDSERITKVNGRLAIWDGSVYVASSDAIESKMLEYKPDLRSTQRSEVLKWLILKVSERSEDDTDRIAFLNGDYSLTEHRLLPHDPDHLVTNLIPWEYHEDAEAGVCAQTIRKMACGDSDVENLLYEAIGYCFYRSNKFSKAFLLKGDGANGKTTFINMIQNLLSVGNVCELDIDQLDERFSVGELAGTLADLADDISDNFFDGKRVSIFKKLTSGNRIKGEFKGERPFFFTPYAKMIFSANTLPRMRDDTGAVLRRMIIIPFNNTFRETDHDYDPSIGQKLRTKESMEWLCARGIEALEGLLERKRFTMPKAVADEIAQYDLENSPIKRFIIDSIGDTEAEKQANLYEKDVEVLYDKYTWFCHNSQCLATTPIRFVKEIKKRCGVTTYQVRKGGVRKMIFKKTEEKQGIF